VKVIVLLVLLGAILEAQTSWQSSPGFALASSALSIVRPAQPRMPFSVAGERGAAFGQQSGTFEAWAFPVKILSHFQITAELSGYPVPIDVNEMAASIEVNPERTTITYSHAAFTIKQHMAAPRHAADGAPGIIVFFEFSSIRPLTVTFRFTPEMLRMWPAPNYGRPSAEWVARGQSGYYILHTDSDELSGAVGIPGATPGILAPYQERPRTYPAELKLAFDPARQSGQFFPLLMTAGKGNSALGRRIQEWSSEWPSVYAQTAAYYAHFFDDRLTVHTPDPQFDLAMRWAEIAIDQCQVRYGGETGLIAGYYSSADSARPGFGWFFGRDTLFTLYAVNSYGDWALSRRALDFLVQRQRQDGKIMHEFSQTADLVDWKATPYFYAAADATPLFIMTVNDYLKASGDLDFVKRNWEAVKRAWAFTRAHDSDGDGIYENTEGTGWVESWPPGMPHQEIYLAALDQQSCAAMSRLATQLGDSELAAKARQQADLISAHIESEYYDATHDAYAFSRNADGTLDASSTIFPAIAWWDGSFSLAHAAGTLRRWASAEFSTDWGLRDLSPQSPVYDPISYHQGSVWPLYTGWASLAEYRAERPLAGYTLLMENAGMTFTQDLGAVTELLSGEYFQPFGRSSPHQLWSSAMVITPALRGLFGMEWDAAHNTLRVSPQMPASWNSARIESIRLGANRFDLTLNRAGGKLVVEARPREGSAPCLTAAAGAQAACSSRLEIALPAVELEQPVTLPLPGAVTSRMKVISQARTEHQLTLEAEGPGTSSAELLFRFHSAGVKVSGATVEGERIHIRFPGGTGYQRQTITFSW
jgi:hypothetical protein